MRGDLHERHGAEIANGDHDRDHKLSGGGREIIYFTGTAILISPCSTGSTARSLAATPW